MVASPARDRLLAVAILALVLALAAIFLIAPAMDRHFDVRARLVAERSLLGRLKEAQVELERRDKAQAQLPAPAASPFLAGRTEAVALSGLQANVTAIAAGNGARPSITRMLPAIEREGMRMVGVHIDILAPLEVIQQILHALESAYPILTIEQITLEPISPAARMDGNDAGALRAGIHVYGALMSTRG